jgi:hypothetical protein
MKAGRTMRKSPYEQMTVEQLARATAELDREFVVDSFAAPNPRERRWFERAGRKSGRPVERGGAT